MNHSATDQSRTSATFENDRKEDMKSTLKGGPVKSHWDKPFAKGELKHIAALVFAYGKWLFWIVITKVPLFLVYLDLLSQGIIRKFPEMGRKLSKLTGMGFLDDYEFTYRLTQANFFALIPLLATMFFWHALLLRFVAPDRFQHIFRHLRIEAVDRVVLVLGVIIISLDSALFAVAFSLSSWGQSQISVTAMLAAILYAACMAFSAFMIIHATLHILELHKEGKKL